jgi:hypothetical protein
MAQAFQAAHVPRCHIGQVRAPRGVASYESRVASSTRRPTVRPLPRRYASCLASLARRVAESQPIAIDRLARGMRRRYAKDAKVFARAPRFVHPFRRAPTSGANPAHVLNTHLQNEQNRRKSNSTNVFWLLGSPKKPTGTTCPHIAAMDRRSPARPSEAPNPGDVR